MGYVGGGLVLLLGATFTLIGVLSLGSDGSSPLVPLLGLALTGLGVKLIRDAARGADAVVCTRCGSQGVPRTETPGSVAVELVLWLLLIVPGIIYSVWRGSARRKVCRVCGSPEVVPAASPRAQQIVRSHTFTEGGKGGDEWHAEVVRKEDRDA